MIRSKLLFIVIVPLLFVIMLSSIILYGMLEQKTNLELTKRRTVEAKAVSLVVHYMQIERGLTSGIIAGNAKDNELFKETKQKLNKAVHEAKIIYSRAKNANVSVLDMLCEIEQQREDINLLEKDISEARNFYTKKIAALLNIIKTIPAMMDDRENRNFIQAYGYLSSAKEALGRTRATLVEVFTVNRFSDESYISTKEYLSAYYSSMQSFSLVAPKPLLSFHKKNYTGESIDKTFTMIADALNNKNSTNFNTDPSFWFNKTTESINLLKTIEDKLFDEVDTLTNKKLYSINYKISILLSFLLISAVIITILMITAIKKILSSTKTLQKGYSDSLALLEQYKQTVDRSFIVSKTDRHGIITYVNDEFCKISGYSREELLGQSHNIIRHRDMDKELFLDMWHTIKKLKQPWIGEVKNLSKNGSPYWMRAIINPIFDNEGNILEYIGIRVDITQQKEIEEYFQNQLKLSDKNFNCSLHLSKEYEKAIDLSTILSRTDKKGKITYANDKFVEISGFSLNELVGMTHSIIASPETPKEAYRDIWKTILRGGVWKGVIQNRSKHGRDFWTHTTIVPIRDIEGNTIEYLAIRYDITEIMEQRKEFERIAKTDILTGCGNRFRLNSDMRELNNLSAAIFNIDNFRQINDFYGHKLGDIIIKSTADKIYEQIRHDRNFRFYRLQGDEFIALAVNYSQEMLIKKAREILDIIKEKFTIQEEEILISCTCGISFEDKEHLLSSANMALKIAKKSKVDYLVYNESISLNEEYENNIKWTKKLSDAIKNDNIIAYYQPIVDNSTLQHHKYESLVRMIDNGEVISPFFFLDISKQTRQYFYITKAVIAKSFEVFMEKDVEFSVNLSILDILEPQITDYIEMMLQKYDIGSRVVFEIVESEYIQNFEKALAFIDKVREYGCKIAIDDFGTGYSNFGYLIKLKADYLKIDGSLIRHIDKDENSYIVVSTIVDFAKRLGMKTIAEFVENEEIFNIVKKLGIDYSQGYYFSPPKRDI